MEQVVAIAALAPIETVVGSSVSITIRVVDAAISCGSSSACKYICVPSSCPGIAPIVGEAACAAVVEYQSRMIVMCIVIIVLFGAEGVRIMRGGRADGVDVLDQLLDGCQVVLLY